MTRSSSQPPIGLTVFYLALALIAPVPLAWKVAETCVRAAGVSDFEGASTFATLYQTPLWSGLMTLGLCGVFWTLRRHTAVLWLVALVLIVPALPVVVWIFKFSYELAN